MFSHTGGDGLAPKTKGAALADKVVDPAAGSSDREPKGAALADRPIIMFM